ncbi:TonB-dependent outer membrane receptor, SusC/RagA family [Psychroflexus torquis ATCC 700755]|uniref:TonB-dependent outer membrane receptor, SusC/RagA family n=1 Tax=Psychroflexus torquis (strain ATCC 700755 / CIP 106069 / ACAM 623) TaxID=313595 RepID=K4ICY8_PSYTT|nr:TonB-dependent receptor [Psychroflexus torquis]AFU68452.1 TonB-dependent outer membrane receptor, SusC/RagA family [Psychroflexus torquis ATCC 700755]
MKNYLLICFLFLGNLVFSQESKISGTVLDNLSQPMPGVSIAIKGTNKGTITNFDGEYAVEASLGQTLVFTFMGFDPREVVIDQTLIDIQMVAGTMLGEVVLIGSRSPSRTVIESAVPVDVLDIKKISTAVPQVNLNQMLNYVAPSFTSNTQTIADGTDHIDPASLRGLGPDQVLVLINGKRRHNSSLINVNGSFGRGSVGTDLNAIPVVAIQRIEVLRDGAAAQYGSDAIAGVINIVLNESVGELDLNITSGANFSKNANKQTGGIDGETINVAASYGIGLGDKGGFINFSGDFDYREPFNRMAEWEGSIFNAYNAIERVGLSNGIDISNLSNSQIQQLGQQVSYFDSNFKNEIASANDRSALQDLLSMDVTESELDARGQQRSDYNMRVGQSALRGGRFFANLSLPIDDAGTELYSFAGISSRRGESAGFYRLPNQSRTYTPVYINGFLPRINSKIKDQSLAVGIKGIVGDWNVDFSNTYGQNRFDYLISNTSNASLESASPTSFDAGGFSFAQNTTNLDISQYFVDIYKGLNVAFGAEHRLEKYDIVAGERASYEQYTENGDVINNATQIPAQDFFGNTRRGGSQVFPGFSPENEISRERTSIGGYFDVEVDFTDKFLLAFATRFENYSDFGSTINFKIASRYKLSENVNIRGSVNTGFRAPSLHQLNFNSTSTIFNDEGEPVQVGTFSNDSRAAQLLGIPELKEETSSSLSVGLTAKIPDANLSFTVDGYFVAIDDRVVYTGQFRGPGTGTELDQLLSQANATAAAFFANAINTESKGIDAVITHNTVFGKNLRLKSDLAATFSKTKQVGDILASPELERAGLVDTYFPEDSRIYLEEAVPRTKVNLSNSLAAGKFNFFLRNVYFGKVTEASSDPLRQQEFSGKVITDLSVSFKATEALTLTIGSNNIFDIYPEAADPAFGNRSSGRFDWSRSAQQFGFSGRFLFARVSINLK